MTIPPKSKPYMEYKAIKNQQNKSDRKPVE